MAGSGRTEGGAHHAGDGSSAWWPPDQQEVGRQPTLDLDNRSRAATRRSRTLRRRYRSPLWMFVDETRERDMGGLRARSIRVAAAALVAAMALGAALAFGPATPASADVTQVFSTG